MLRRKATIYVYLGLGLALAIGAIMAITIFAADRENKNSRKVQADVVRYETDHILTALSGKLTTMIYWQDAYDKAAASWDQKWVAYQFGPYLNSIDINVVGIFDAQGHLLFHYTHGMTHPPVTARIAANENIREIFRLTRGLKTMQPPIVKMAVIDLDG
ncbi:MAG TPA: CHASE4 domain-containing protein, partial [Rhizomicrobium sp.]|nr:CHASE4 domain-containing protein [Rhizomicrobium sp.]